MASSPSAATTTRPYRWPNSTARFHSGQRCLRRQMRGPLPKQRGLGGRESLDSQLEQERSWEEWGQPIPQCSTSILASNLNLTLSLVLVPALTLVSTLTPMLSVKVLALAPALALLPTAIVLIQSPHPLPPRARVSQPSAPFSHYYSVTVRRRRLPVKWQS